MFWIIVIVIIIIIAVVIVQSDQMKENAADREKYRRIQEEAEASLAKSRAAVPQEVRDQCNAIITPDVFFAHYPCQICNARGAWKNTKWEIYSREEVYAEAECSKCGFDFETLPFVTPEYLRSIANVGSVTNPYWKRTAGQTYYLNDPCPYCGAYQVRYAKWDDKSMSAAVWGAFSYKLHCTYKCDKCKNMWE